VRGKVRGNGREKVKGNGRKKVKKKKSSYPIARSSHPHFC
jgi:hypothetical protein